MPATAFRARNGFDAAGNRLINLADPALTAAGTEFEPHDGINWDVLRAHTGLRLVPDAAARTALETAPGELVVGDIVLDQDTGLAWKFAPPNVWEPFGRGGLTYVGRQGNLPNIATDVISHGQLFVVRMDFDGDDLYRLAVWDDTIPARPASDPGLIRHTENIALPVLGIPTVATLTLSGMPGVSNAEADVVARVNTTAGGTHTFLYRVQPGENLEHVVRMLAQVYNAAPHDPALRASASGDILTLTGSPGAPALSGRTVQGGRFAGAVNSDVQLAAFLGSGGIQAGDFVLNSGAIALTTPDGRTVPTDTAVIVETVTPLMYHVADVPTPLPPIQQGTQNASGTMTAIDQMTDLVAWLNSSPANGDYALNVASTAFQAGGHTLLQDHALIKTPGGVVASTTATPAVPQVTGATIYQALNDLGAAITDQDAIDRLTTSGLQAGDWFEWTGVTTFDPLANGSPGGLGQPLDAGDWVSYDGTRWVGIKGATYPAGVTVTIGGTVVPGVFDPPTTLPTAVYNLAQQPPATPDATVPATPQTDPTNITSFRVAVANIGSTVNPPGGGWRWLNREVWAKPLRSTSDQLTDQRPGDLQVTRENAHQELKAWNQASGQWDIIYSRDEINAAIAAMSLFEGTVNEVGGGAIGAMELDRLPDLAAMTQVADLSQVSHYWTWVGAPSYAVGKTTPIIGRDLDGAVLNPGDWIQVANRGTVAAPDLRWVTVGGDLLAKARADRLFGLLPWTQGGWEQGALVLYQGDVYRASQPVTGVDPNPNPQATAISVPLSGTSGGALSGGAAATFPVAPANGDAEVATAPGTHAPGDPFAGQSYATGAQFIYSSDPAFSGAGITAEGYAFNKGWISVGLLAPVPNPLDVTPPVPVTPWHKVDISGGLKVAQDDAALPLAAPPGQVWIVLASGRAGGRQALYSYDSGSSLWQELGGGGVPMDLNGGTTVYPRVFYIDQDLPGVPIGAPLPVVTISTLMTSTFINDADLLRYPPDPASAYDGEWWNFSGTVSASTMPAWAGQPDFTGADILVYVGGNVTGVTESGYVVIDGIVRLPSTLYNAGMVLNLRLKAPGIPDPEIPGDMLVTKVQAGYPLVKAISMDGRRWHWYHPQRVSFDDTGAGKPPKADYPTQLNVGFSGGKATITHIADRNLSWVEVSRPLRLWQVATAGSFQTSGQGVQVPNGVSFPAHGAVFDRTKLWKIEFNTRFNAAVNLIDPGAQGNWYMFGARLCNSGGGEVARKACKTPFILDGYYADWGFTGTIIIPAMAYPDQSITVILPYYESQIGQQQSGSWINQTVDYIISETT